MKPSQDTYPIFEANQVLSYTHLNQVFSYLDEQERLTRANLIGIGIVCGLEISLDSQADAIALTRGCGVTSEGYLIIEPDDVSLVAYRPYTLPDDLEYPPFLDSNDKQYDLWELFPAGEPNTTPLPQPTDFLKGKAVLLFLELKKEGLRNCSLNDCDDRGSQVAVAVRRLLIRRTDLDLIIAKAAGLAGNISTSDLEASLLSRVNLPDLRLPRYDVPNTFPATSQDVLEAFHAVFATAKLAFNTGAALSAAYAAFKPLLQEKYPSDPFSGFAQKFSFLDGIPLTTTQVRFLQYYYELFDDLIHGYDEFRWKGIELLCICCPPEELFPRHLMLGLLFPQEVNNPEIYRNFFLSSAAANGCGDRIKELVILFDRLVAMIDRFTDQPPLAPVPMQSRSALPLRITPSKLGCAPLSEKAIPYYYLEDGTPPLYRLWNPAKTRVNRANQNLSYRSYQYVPVAPPFVTEPLRYDLEPYNFLRIEGHLGFHYLRVLSNLLSLKSRYRLPIEIVALRTGAYTDQIAVDVTKDDCRFQDLETLYETLKEDLICFLCKEVQYFYGLPYQAASNAGAGKPKLPLLVHCAPSFLVQPRTLGRYIEDWLAQQPGMPEIDPNVIINFLNTHNLGQTNLIISYIIVYISKLYDQLAVDLQTFDFPAFLKRYQDLVNVAEGIEREREQSTANVQSTANILRWEEVDDRLEDIIYRCRLDAFQALEDEYQRRVRQVKEKQLLSVFLRDNPGIQHKGGVPLGGTFVIVYHAVPDTGPVIGAVAGARPGTGTIVGAVAGSRFAGIRTAMASVRSAVGPVEESAVKEAFARVSANRKLATDPDIRFLIGAFTGRVPDISIAPPAGGAGDIIDAAVSEIADGTVIADFFLPYLYCSDCPPIQFVLPKAPPTFTVEIGCTNADNRAEVTVKPEGGLAPYSVKVDQQDYQPLDGALLLAAGQHTLVLQDAEATESAPQTITVPARLELGTPSYDCVAADQYVATFDIQGGTPPYSVSGKPVTGTSFSTDPIPSGDKATITVTDQNKCSASIELQHTCESPCNLPCDGESRRCAFRLWIQPPNGGGYEIYQQDSAITLRFNDQDIELPDTSKLLQFTPAALNGSFQKVITEAVKKLNAVVNEALVKALGDAGKDRLVISLPDPSQKYPFGVLLIEHFVCETFSLEFSYSYAKPAPGYSLTVRYVSDQSFSGATFINRRLDDKEIRVPAFDCAQRNLCTPTDYKKLCQGAAPKPSVQVKADGSTYALAGKVASGTEVIAWVWDVVKGRPSEPFYEGQKVKVSLEHAGGTVRLTVITKDGCFGALDRPLG